MILVSWILVLALCDMRGGGGWKKVVNPNQDGRYYIYCTPLSCFIYWLSAVHNIMQG